MIRGPLLKTELAAMARLAGPVVVVQLGLMGMGLLDTFMLGHLSPTALAAGALGNRQVWTVMVFPFGILMGLDPVLSQAVGANDQAGLSRGFKRGLLLAATLGLLFAGLLFLTEPFLRWTAQPAAASRGAAAYAHICSLGVLPFLVFAVLRQTLQALHHLWPIVLVILVANAVNGAMNWILIYGNLGAPALGVEGAAWASVTSRWCMALLLLSIAWRSFSPLLRLHDARVYSVARLWGLLRLGVPIGFQVSLEMGIFSLVALLMGAFGENSIGGHEVAIQLASFSFMVPLGIATAASVRVGHAVGRGDPAAARLSAGVALWVAGLVMATFGVVYLSIPRVLGSWWTPDADVLAVAALLIPLAGVFQIADGVQVVAAGILRGLGDTRTPLFANLLGFWAVGFPVSFGLAFWAGWREPGLWWGLVLGLALVAMGLVWRVRIQLGRGGRRVNSEEFATPMDGTMVTGA